MARAGRWVHLGESHAGVAQTRKPRPKAQELRQGKLIYVKLKPVYVFSLLSGGWARLGPGWLGGDRPGLGVRSVAPCR
jgi:hypothetical protein